jgi:hypothetical protein
MPGENSEFTHKVTVRCTKRTKERIRTTMRRWGLEEAQTIRLMLNAGLTCAERKGIGYVMEIDDRLRDDQRKP